MTDTEQNQTTEPEQDAGDLASTGNFSGSEQEQDAEQDAEQPEQDAEQPEQDADTFPREYVEQLRGEAAGHRQDARDAQRRVADLEAEVWRMRVIATGRLADPSDLPIPEDRLDADVDAAVTALLASKPHLAARRATGRIGQGEPSKTAAPGLADMLRAGA